MKSIVTALLVSLTLSAVSLAAEGGWITDHEKALEKAKAENKLVLMDFTGSDWCGWCIKLDKEVFSKPKFKQYARENLVLLELDYPQNKRQTKKLVEQNEKLKNEYNIKGYPTIIVLNSGGEKVGQLGYVEGGPEAFIAAVEKLKAK